MCNELVFSVMRSTAWFHVCRTCCYQMTQCLLFLAGFLSVLITATGTPALENFGLKTVYPCYILVLLLIQSHSSVSLFIKYLSSIWYRSTFLACLVN